MPRRRPLLDILLGRQTRWPDWNVPPWNRPAGQEFIAAQQAIEVAFTRLLEIEEALDAHSHQWAASEFGERCEAAPALLAKMRFDSTEWCQAWQDLLDAVHKAEEVARHWHEETGN